MRLCVCCKSEGRLIKEPEIFLPADARRDSHDVVASYLFRVDIPMMMMMAAVGNDLVVWQ